MDRKLCLKKDNAKLYKIVKEVIDKVTGLPLVLYHYIENNGLIFTMPKKQFEEEFVRLNIRENRRI